MIFSRRRGAGRHAKAEEPGQASAASRTMDRQARRQALLEELELIEAESSEPVAQAEPIGPYDISGAPSGDRVDLGSLLIPAIDGVEIRLHAGNDGIIQQLELAHEGNLLQLAVFAAPRTGGLWDEVRPEIRSSLFSDGVAADETPGRWGTELRARLRTQQGLQDLRLIGIDGPRWMVRAVLRGPAAVDPALAGPLDTCLTGLVVRRGEEARPTSEALPLQMPEHMLAAAAGGGQVPAQVPAAVPEQAMPTEVDGGDESRRAASPPPRRKPSPRPRRD